MIRWIALLLVLGTSAAMAEEKPAMLIVIGAEGEASYGKRFAEQAGKWREIADRAQVSCITIGPAAEGSATMRDAVQAALGAQSPDGAAPLWLVLIGHGTFDGRDARFNLTGPDLAAADLREWLSPIHRPLVLINTSSASGAMMPALSGPNRIVITATRSGAEYYYARFGGFLADAIVSDEADRDRDGQTSLLEAFLHASQRTAGSYDAEGRLASEHAVIEDTGDAVGVQAADIDSFPPLPPLNSEPGPEGGAAHRVHLFPSADERQLTAEQRVRRDDLERRILTLRQERKTKTLADAAYYAELEPLALELSRLYQAANEQATDTK